MTWKNHIALLAIAPRRRVMATALVYGLSLSVRFTSATGEEVEIPTQYMQRAGPMISITTKDSVQLPYADWGPIAAQPILFRRSWPQRASSMPTCTPP